MAVSHHNIERALPSKFYQYVTWDAAGRKFIIQKHDQYKGYRAAQVMPVTDTSIPYFYARTLKAVSATLETIK
jgi:hypothetical protein